MGKRLEVKAFGERLKTARLKRHLTQGQVVFHLHRAGLMFEGFTRGQLSNYENGLVLAPDPVVLLYLSRLYGASLVELIELLATGREEATSTLGTQRGRSTAKGRRASSG